ncbi:MAG: erythromycin esterase family protein [Proteobacteria bacterium]|nr:erythromycin esterase family protein [Pseudomonadota bacterium]
MDDLAALIARTAEPLPALDSPTFAEAFDRFADRRVVLLGEASHGTAEFYRARAAITRRLVERHGFNIVAVEADWPDASAIDRYVRGRPAPADTEPPFKRFPTWMWRNTEVAGLVAWLRAHNAELPFERRTGFHGLDLYNLGSSITEVLAYLDKTDPEAAAEARVRYGCLTPWAAEPARYGRRALSEGYSRCERAVVQMCQDLLQRQRADGHDDDLLDASANARLIASAERYYRVMYYGDEDSWNLRDTHMADTLDQLLQTRGPHSKAVVWANNSHIGDARETDMGWSRGELNLGQLCRERYGEATALIGFGTHTGTVAAASDWGGEMEVKRVNPSRPDSVERLFHEAGLSPALLDFSRADGLVQGLAQPRLERFIGVIYRPDTERWSHYSDARLSRQFDAWVWFDETEAVQPLDGDSEEGLADTFPFGL